MSLPRYPKYKDSGVEWLGQVPEHWAVMPIRKAARLESGHTPSRNHPEYWENCTVPWFSLADVWQIREEGRSVIYETNEKVSELGLANSSARRLPPGTVMLSRTASVGFSAIMGVEMATTQDFANWICGDRLKPEFLLSVFRSMRGEFRRMMMGSTHNTIYMPDIQALRFALPPLPEQAAIAAFLDAEIAKIDALVAEQQRLIDLLKEKRQAVISHAVTRGLNPDAPIKASGIDWLGDVPAHWNTMRLKHISPTLTVGIVVNPAIRITPRGRGRARAPGSGCRHGPSRAGRGCLLQPHQPQEGRASRDCPSDAVAATESPPLDPPAFPRRARCEGVRPRRRATGSHRSLGGGVRARRGRRPEHLARLGEARP